VTLEVHEVEHLTLSWRKSDEEIADVGRDTLSVDTSSGIGVVNVTSSATSPCPLKEIERMSALVRVMPKKLPELRPYGVYILTV